MSADVLTNQILKASLGQILETESLDRDLRAEVRQTRRLFDQISNLTLSPRVFYQVRAHQNNRLYAFLINVCRFLFDSLQALDQAGGYKFQDILREPERLRRISLAGRWRHGPIQRSSGNRFALQPSAPIAFRAPTPASTAGFLWSQSRKSFGFLDWTVQS
jgi:hypothetical protein